MLPTARRRLLIQTLSGATGAWLSGRGHAADPSDAVGLSFALVGDLPYSNAAVQRARQLFDQLNTWPLDFVLHVGDIQDSHTPCSDALLAERAALFARSRHPLLLLAGDNEWTDCHRHRTGAQAPLERLQALRARFWARPEALGTLDPARPRLALRRQDGQPENIHWQVGAVHGVGLHVVGSHNGLEIGAGSRAAFAQRQQANDRWLNQAVAHALQARAAALLIAFHANPDFEAPLPKTGYEAHLQSLRRVAEQFSNPIVLLHGDTHRFRVDTPLRDRHGQRFRHVTRVECFGHPFDHAWVHLVWHPGQPGRFTITPRALAPALPLEALGAASGLGKPRLLGADLLGRGRA